MKVAAMLAAVREAMKYARLETAEFGSITRHQGRGPIDPVRNLACEIAHRGQRHRVYSRAPTRGSRVSASIAARASHTGVM